VGWAAEPTAEEQRVLQATVSKLTQALNARNVEAMLPRLAAEFSAFAPMAGWWGTKRLQSDERAREQYRNVELATLVRSLRMVTPEVALGDGFFRTIGAPGGDASGRVYLVLTKTASHWQVLSARFAPRPTDPTFINIEPAKEHAAPGPDGWVTLFDGKSLEAFEHPANPQRALTWKVVEGTIAATPGNGQAGFRTKDTYRSFELRWEWKLPEKGNSGVKYQLFYLAGGDGAGHEYQLADDNGDPGAKKYPVERTGSLYNQIAPSKAAAKPIGEWNSSVLIVKGRQCEHWLNGEKVVEYETESSPLESPILFQHHTTEAWFRNIRIKRLD
jgi:hypothetical protein